MKKLFKALTYGLISILIVSSLTFAVYEVSPWKTRSGDTVGNASKLWTGVYTEYLYLFDKTGIVVEGDTEDAYETTIGVIEPTADNSINFPNASGTVVLSALTTNTADAANSIWFASNALTFEGATADAYETSITVEDSTVDRTITLPNYTGGVPLIIAQGNTQTLLEDTTAVDITGSSLSIAAGWLTAGKTIKYTLGGTKTGANGTAIIYFDVGGTVLTLTSAGNTAGDWTATIIYSEYTDAAHQGILGTFIGADGTVVDYAATTTDVSGAVTLKAQVDLGHADDAITCDYVLIEHWVK